MPVAFPLARYHLLNGGVTAPLTLHGDEFLNWWTDSRGNTIVSNRKGVLHYAQWNEEFNAFEPLEKFTSVSYADRLDATKYPDVLEPPSLSVCRELIMEKRRYFRNPQHIPDPTKPELCGSCPTAGVCDPMCESAHTHCSGCCTTCTCNCCEEPEPEPEIPDPFIVKDVKEGSIIRPILPIYVRFNSDGEGCPRLDLPNYYMEDQIIAKHKFQTLANYYYKQTQGAVKLVNLGIRYVKLLTPPRNYSQHLDEVFDDIVYPALQFVARHSGVNFFKYRRCCDKYRPCRIDPTTCTPLFIVHGFELSAGCVGPGVWGHARWGLGHVKVNGVDFDFDTYMVVGAFMDSVGALTAEDAIADIEPLDPYIPVPDPVDPDPNPDPDPDSYDPSNPYDPEVDYPYIPGPVDPGGDDTPIEGDDDISYEMPSDDTYPELDIIFLCDVTGSMAPKLRVLEYSLSRFGKYMVEAGIKNVRFGVASYWNGSSDMELRFTPYPTPDGSSLMTDSLQGCKVMLNNLIADGSHGGAEWWSAAIESAYETYSPYLRHPTASEDGKKHTAFIILSDEFHDIDDTRPVREESFTNASNIISSANILLTCVGICNYNPPLIDEVYAEGGSAPERLDALLLSCGTGYHLVTVGGRPDIEGVDPVSWNRTYLGIINEILAGFGDSLINKLPEIASKSSSSGAPSRAPVALRSSAPIANEGVYTSKYIEPSSAVSVTPNCACVLFMQPGTLVHEAGHALFYLQDLYDADGPGLPETKDISFDDGSADIVLAVDTSGSMGEEITAIQNEIRYFTHSLELSGLTNWRIGVLDYHSRFIALTTSSGEIWASTEEEAADLVDKLVLSGGNAHHGEAIKWAIENYTWRPAVLAKYIILITDAGDEGGTVSISDAAALCRTNNIQVYTVVQDAYKGFFGELRDSSDKYIELLPTGAGLWGDKLSTQVVSSVVNSVRTSAGSYLSGFGLWSPMAFGNWGMSLEYKVPAELPSNLDAYSLYQIQPRLTVPQWSSGTKTISAPYIPHSIMLNGAEPGTLTRETFLLQLRDYESYDSGIIGFWSISGFLDLTDANDRARLKPGVLVAHDMDAHRIPLLDENILPADIHEAHGGNRNLMSMPDDSVSNYADPEDLFFGGTFTTDADHHVYGDFVADPDNLMVSVRKGEVAGFDITDMDYVGRTDKDSPNRVFYNIVVNGPVPVEWNDMSKWPDDLLKPEVPDECSCNTWCYFGAHFSCAKGFVANGHKAHGKMHGNMCMDGKRLYRKVSSKS